MAIASNSSGGTTAIEFMTSNVAAATTKMRIDNLGNVGIGTISLNEKLNVAGNIAPSGDNTYSLGTAGLRWTDVFAVSGSVNTSDRRLKDNIEDIDHGLEDVKALRPVSFTWKDRPGRGKKLGLVAQEVREVINEVVHVGDDADSTLGIYYSDLVPVLIKAIQEQQALIERQESDRKELIDELAHTNGELRTVTDSLGELTAAVRRLEGFLEVGVGRQLEEGSGAVAMTTTTDEPEPGRKEESK